MARLATDDTTTWALRRAILELLDTYRRRGVKEIGHWHLHVMYRQAQTYARPEDLILLAQRLNEAIEEAI